MDFAAIEAQHEARAKTFRNQAQRRQQAETRALEWVKSVQKAARTGDPVVTPKIAADKAARRAMQRERQRLKQQAQQEQQEQQPPQQPPQQKPKLMMPMSARSSSSSSSSDGSSISREWQHEPTAEAAAGASSSSGQQQGSSGAGAAKDPWHAWQPKSSDHRRGKASGGCQPNWWWNNKHGWAHSDESLLPPRIVGPFSRPDDRT